jgi:hypothetical protein
MYTQYFLKFSSKEEMHTVLTEVDWYGEIGVADGETVYGFKLSGHDGALDEVGLVVETEAVYDQVTFEEVSPPVYVDGWHLNAVLKNPLPESLQEFVVYPNTPSRIFAGFEV